jgi:chromosome segregation ATPase
MTPAEHETLREIGAYLGSLAEDLAQCAEAVSELAGAVETLIASQAAMQDALTALTGRFVQLHDEQRETNARLNLYLDDATRAEVGMRKLQSDVRKVDERLKGLGG